MSIVIRQSSIVMALLVFLLGPLAPEPTCAVVNRPQFTQFASAVLLIQNDLGRSSAGLQSDTQSAGTRLTGLARGSVDPTRSEPLTRNGLPKSERANAGSSPLPWSPVGHGGLGLEPGLPRLGPAHASTEIPAPTVVHTAAWRLGGLNPGAPQRTATSATRAGQCAPGPELPPPVFTAARG